MTNRASLPTLPSYARWPCPDPRAATPHVAARLINAFKSIAKRDVGRMVEESLIDCHSYERAVTLATREAILPLEFTKPDRRDLDDAVFELLGVESPSDRAQLVDRLYTETTKHYRDVRVTEIQKMEDRRTGGKTKFATTDHAADAWDALDLTDLTPLPEWVNAHAAGECEVVSISTERPVHLAGGGMFDNETVYFGKSRRKYFTSNLVPKRNWSPEWQHLA
ncbi:MAG: hypothetical protein IAF94_09225 [Pirellulaceae bacterium]|nr:hypothetical protein [Pirellulaceae bacterium]